MVVVMALGGSTNAVLHLIAMARAVEVPLTIDDFQKVSNRVPLPGRPQAQRPFVQEDLHHVGGTPAVMKYLLEKGLLDGDCLTVTGKTLAENLRDLPGLKAGPEDRAYRSKSRSRRPGHIQILRGNLAPDGAVAKITGKEGLRFSGPAKVYDSEEDMLHALGAEGDRQGGRGRHPLRRTQGRPRHAGDAHADLGHHGRRPGQDVALLTDGRFSGGSHGFIVGHITPEAQEGGPIALVQNGDRITIDAERTGCRVDLSDAELAARRAALESPALQEPPAARSTSTSRT